MMVIVGASEIELRRVRRLISAERVEVHGGRQFCFGTMRGRAVCLVRAGVGRKNAAAAARAICADLRPAMVIAAGAAGALDPALSCGSAVVVERVLGENSTELIACPPEWAGRALAALHASGMQAQAGSCCQTRTFIHRSSQKQALRAKTGAHIVDMESFAFAVEFRRAGMPFIDLRVVSDSARRDTADMKMLTGLWRRSGRPAVALHLCLRPRELARVLFFYRGMGAAAERIADALLAIVRASIEPVGTCGPADG